MPYRLFMGGVAGAATIPFGWQGIVVGAASAPGRRGSPSTPSTSRGPRACPATPSSRSSAPRRTSRRFLGSVLVLAVPYVGYAYAGVTGFMYWRVRDRRRAKYRRMRRRPWRPRRRSVPRRRSGPPERAGRLEREPASGGCRRTSGGGDDER